MDSSKAGAASIHPSGSRAAILGLGVAVPEHVRPQESFPDYYFGISNSNHMVDLKLSSKEFVSVPKLFYS